MKKFKGKRNLDDIITTANTTGWEVDTKDFDKGGDFIWFRDMDGRVLQVAFNTFNGTFYVYSPISEKPIATEKSTELDCEDWYNELLDMFYEGEKVCQKNYQNL